MAMSTLVVASAAPVGPPAPLAAPHSTRRVHLLSASAVTVTVDAGERATHQINEDLIGTNQAYTPAGALIRAIGPDWGRIDASLQGSIDGTPVYNCRTGAWNPALLAQGLHADEAEGATPEIIVDYSPTCLTTSVPPGTNPAYAPPDAEGWKPWDALVKTMARYAIAHGARVFEVWNEPDWEFFDADLPAYLELYRHTALALESAARSAHVRIEVGGPATFTADLPWISALASLAVRDRLPLDFVSWHDYANDPEPGPLLPTPLGELPPPSPAGFPPYWYDPALSVEQYGAETDAVRATLRQYPSLHPALVIDEWNLDAGYDPRMNGPYDAAFAAAVLQSAQRVGLDKMAFFRVTDSQHGNPYGNWGMLFVSPHGQLAPKPVYWAFVFWHDLAGSEVRADVAASGTLHDLGHLRVTASVPHGAEMIERHLDGARRRARALHVLVSNFTAYDPSGVNGTADPNLWDHEVDLEIRGLVPGTYRVERRAVDALDAGNATGSPQFLHTTSGGRLAMAFSSYGDSVSLVALSRVERSAAQRQ